MSTVKFTKSTVFRIIGIAGTIAGAIIYVRNPSWPTPDKILVYLTFVFMAFGQAKAMLKHLLPFIVLLLVYESFRGLASTLNHNVNYLWMPGVDKLFFGNLPTSTLQNWLWQGKPMWWDFGFYFVYMMHFILPITLALLVWKFKESHYWQVVSTYVVVSFMGFLTFLLFPASPPWLASDKGLIQPVVHTSNYVFGALGFHDFPTLYSKISPNPVAAIPSLHAAYGTLLVIFTYKLFGKKWAALAFLYPLIIYVGTVYSGEHYVIDEVLGAFYAIAAYLLVRWLFNNTHLQKKFNSLVHYKNDVRSRIKIRPRQ
ncbi:MAG: phosphatase PAP2 family protein [Candidatus Saccharimonadales bacterium]